jgi:hypothetical protein
VPATAHVTTLERWREYAYRRGISASEMPRARQAAFQRASEHLVGAQAVGIWDERMAHTVHLTYWRAVLSPGATPKRLRAFQVQDGAARRRSAPDGRAIAK